MPAASVVNGCTGEIRPVLTEDFDKWKQVVDLGINTNISTDLVAERTAGKFLHCAEFWMPGACNLKCKHCYVAHRSKPKTLSHEEYSSLTSNLVRSGLVDVVIPGMEPLLRKELWYVLDAAQESGARSVGITTNGTFLAEHCARLHESSMTVLNISIDGPEMVHDYVRGSGVHAKVTHGVREFRRISDKKLITNTTVMKLNFEQLTDIASWSLDHGFDYAAFHPFEIADDAESTVAPTFDEVISGYELLIEAFSKGLTPSLVLEAEASTIWAIVELFHRGLLEDFDLVIDEAEFLFLKKSFGDKDLLIGLMFYPHHYIRTARISDNGGLASCRSMSQRDWYGKGDIRRTELSALIKSKEVISDLRFIWNEFRSAQEIIGRELVEAFVNFIGSKVTSPNSSSINVMNNRLEEKAA